MKKKNQEGFSLIELLVVVSIMVLLTGIGASIYASSKHVEKVNSAAQEIEGLVMSINSKANSSTDRSILGYQLKFLKEEKKIKLNKLVYPKDDLNQISVGSLELSDYSVENISDYQLPSDVDFSNLGIYSQTNRLYPLESIVSLSKSNRMVFNGGVEPDLGQSNNLYSPFRVEPDSSGAGLAIINLEYNQDEKNFSKSVKIYLKSSQVEIE
jgi:prepilin-type N-terminal cleavage/methylation domain-containing protein